MITRLSENYNRFDYVGLSTDEWQETIAENSDNQVANGTTFFAMDTKQLFMYNKDSSTWIDLTA